MVDIEFNGKAEGLITGVDRLHYSTPAGLVKRSDPRLTPLPETALADGEFDNSQYSFFLDELNDRFNVKYKDKRLISLF